MKTCVLWRSRRNAFEWTIRSRSRWNGVRTLHSGSSGCARPRVSYERTASGESQCSSCSRMRASNASATLPAISGITSQRSRCAGRRKPAFLDDDRHGPAVRAPRGAGHVARLLRTEEHDHRGDLRGLGEPAERPSGADRLQHLVARLPGLRHVLVGETALGEPGVGRSRPGRDGVAADAVLRVQVSDQTREREDGRLRDRVVRHPRRRPLPGARREVDDRAATGLTHRGERCADRPEVAHHVQLPHLVPLRILELFEAREVCDPEVVHEHVEPSELLDRLAHDPLRLARNSEVGDETARRTCALARARDARVVAPDDDDACAFSREQARSLETDAAGRARDEAHLVLQTQVHPRGYLSFVTTILLARHGETDWNVEGRLQGWDDRPLNTTGRTQARELAERLADVPFDAVYASDLSRARETAEIVAEPHGVPVVVDSDLREMNYGSWSGLTRSEIEERFPGQTRHDGETREEHLGRVLAAAERIAAGHPGERVLIVSHGGSLRALKRHCGVDP